MKGVSLYKSYADLVREKATGITEEISAEQQRRFDKGHAAEESARPLVEDMIGETLYPMTATDDDGYLLASSDGSTLPPKGGIGFEHKLWNEKIAAQVAEGSVPESHAWQLDQQIAVFGFEKIIFVVSDGTPDKFVSCEYRSTPERIASLLSGWKQFDKDVANYQPEVIEQKPILVAKSIDNLPALFIEVTGRVTASNLVEFKRHATDVISSFNTNLQTDQDFVDAGKASKFLKDVADNAKRSKKNALEQTTSINELFSALDDVIKMADDVRKTLDKRITEEKDKRKAELVLTAKNELSDHVRKLNTRLGGFMQDLTADFATAIKGLSSIDSMKSKIAAALADAKVTSNEIADRIESNIKSLDVDGQSWRFLFPDLPSVCAKKSDDFSALLTSRIAIHKEAEEKKLAAERERIRKEEQEKIERQNTEERAAREKKIREDETSRAAIEAQQREEARERAHAGLVAITAQSRPAIAVVQETKSTVPFLDLYDTATDLLSRMDDQQIARVVAFCEKLLQESEAQSEIAA